MAEAKTILNYHGIRAMSPSTHNFFSVSQSLNPIDSSLLNCTKPWPLDWPEALIEILQDRIFPISYSTLLFLPSPPMFFCLFSPPILMGCCCCSNLEAIKTLWCGSWNVDPKNTVESREHRWQKTLKTTVLCLSSAHVGSRHCRIKHCVCLLLISLDLHVVQQMILLPL